MSGDWSQWLRIRRGAKNWGWVCPGCGQWVFKLYWSTRLTTLAMVLGGAWAEAAWEENDGLVGDGFVCRRCAGLVYESSERTSRPAPGRGVDVWDRFVKRISGGALRGREVVVGEAAEPGLGS